MTGAWRTLRVQLAAVGFVAIYAPVLILFAVTSYTEQEETLETDDGVEITAETSSDSPPWVLLTAAALAPVAAGLAWWWAGRAVGPIDRVRRVAEEIEASDLGRRIGLDQGPTEVVALAASFDAMLDRLQQAAETQGRLIEETSHELRTPLAVLAANADVVLAHPDPTPEVYREGLRRSKAAAGRMLRTIEDLLVDARGRARTIDRRPADVVALVGEVLDEARVLAAVKHVELSFAGPACAAAPIDGPAVRRAVANLVDNAVKYAPAGSTVDIEIGTPTTEVTVVITDQGPGIPPDQRPHVTDRFWRGDDATEGTGLGLAIAHQIAQAHGGTLTITSPAPTGTGTQARLTLRRVG